ncbi:hypothetical protein LJ707_05930 [Mucilaginibacter sp. UR6-1]|uniref:hypothetical protein n=1 Tax=Mucilaginibacter sp. UR6-1 TaxID=1435643 RepID=UPI001E5F7622|nr:hypothetical protein [Mucilaginibacter sp. UR6-1]MCC8408461.1 hypothetical protein [Mucilaginibacter sp. UR6-1]
MAGASVNAFAQTAQKRVLGTFYYLGKVYNYEFIKNDINLYSFSISSITEDTKKVVSEQPDEAISDTTGVAGFDTNIDSLGATPTDTTENTTTDTAKKDNSVSVFSDFNKDAFVAEFQNVMESRYNVKRNNNLRDKGVELFFSISAKLEFIDDEPITANVILKKDYVKSFLIANSSPYYSSILSKIIVDHYISKVDVETEDGAIKNIIVNVVYPWEVKKNVRSPRRVLEFKNTFPISISGKHDPERFSKVNLYCFDCGGVRGLNRYIKLSDLLFLDLVLANDKEDYSPANSTIHLDPGNPIRELKKEKRSKILDIAAFSDFVGLDQEQPNGLIQIEAKRKININTKYKPLKNLGIDQDIASKYDLTRYDFKQIKDQKKGSENMVAYEVIPKKTSLNRDANQPDQLKGAAKSEKSNSAVDTVYIYTNEFKPGYYNFFASVEPRLLFSKLDGNNKFILLDQAQTDSKRLNPLKNFQYQLVSFGATLNFLKFYYPQSKLTWNAIDVGTYWYHSRVQEIKDSTTNNSTPLNNGYVFVSSLVTFRPDSRWGVNLGASYILQKTFNNDYKFDHNKGLLQANFDAFIKTNDDSKLFFRYRWIFDGHNFNNNFTQIQLGYSLNIFTGSNGKK